MVIVGFLSAQLWGTRLNLQTKVPKVKEKRQVAFYKKQKNGKIDFFLRDVMKITPMPIKIRLQKTRFSRIIKKGSCKIFVLAAKPYA